MNLLGTTFKISNMEVKNRFLRSATMEYMADIEGFVTDDVIVERGNPVEEILKHSKDRNCDLIVMGTHGQGTLEDVMLGSTARRVIRRSKIPVLVVRLPAE